MSSKIKTGDEVIILTGKYKGKTGKVLKFVKQANRAIVEGINMVKKHVKPDPRAQKPGGIEEREAPIHVSNLAIYNPVSKKADRVGFKFLDDGKKVRIFRSDNESIDV